MEYSGYEQKYQNDKITIYQADCMKMLPQIPDKYYQLCIVDPPYGINYAKRVAKNKTSVIRYAPRTWDLDRPPQSYFDEIRRVSIYQIIWGGNYFLDYLGNSKGMVCWDKCQPEGLDQAMCEFAWTNIDRSAKIVRTSIQQIQFTRIHPTQKPVALYDWILRNYAKPGQRILDTHLGSGSSAIAAHYFGCDFVGCEIDVDYFNAAKERFDRETRQVAMF